MIATGLKTAIGDGWRSIRSKARGSAIVLTYHRIADLEFDPQLLAVSVDRFAEHAEVLSRAHHLMTAGELFETMASGTALPARTVVITLDDGYADTLLNAARILAAHDIPATAFVSSDYVGATREFWWDELERVVLLGPAMPPSIGIAVGEATYAAQHRAAVDDDEAAPDDPMSWDITKPVVTERQRVYLELGGFLRRLTATERETALAQLREQFGAEPLVRETHRPLKAAELRELHDGGVIEIGAHTQSHQLLSELTTAAQDEEIRGSKSSLEQLCGGEVRSFSYPFGTTGAFTDDTERAVRDAGFLGACTTEFGMVVPWMDRFAVPRCPTEDVSGIELARLVDAWFRMAR